MSILIDHRSGSEELICYPPFNLCPKCNSPITITRVKLNSKPKSTPKPNLKPRIESAHCSLNPSHHLLGNLSVLSRINKDRATSPDVYFTGNGPDNSTVSIAIEIKSANDLLSSIVSGRLAATQIPDLASYDHPWIAWYGNVREHNGIIQLQSYNARTQQFYWYDFQPAKPFSYLENFLDSPSLTSTRIRVKHYRSLADIAFWIGKCHYPLWQKPYTSHRSLSRFDDTLRLPSSHLLPTIDPHTYQLMKYAAANDTIDFIRALSVAQHFESGQDMFNAGVEEWAEIKVRSKTGRESRIGVPRAQAIVNAIRQRRSK